MRSRRKTFRCCPLSGLCRLVVLLASQGVALGSPVSAPSGRRRRGNFKTGKRPPPPEQGMKDPVAWERARRLFLVDKITRERLPLHEEPPGRASHFPSPRAQGGIAYLSVCLGVPLVGCHRDDVAAPRDSHVMGDGSRPAGDSPDRDDHSADRPERSSADSSQRDSRAGPPGSVRGAWGADRDHTSSKNLGATPAE